MGVMKHMEREELIKKWLDNDLSPLELEAFKRLEDYKELETLSYNLKRFKAPEYNTSDELKVAMSNIQRSASNKSSNNWLQAVLKIAAVVLVSFSVFYYASTLDTDIQTLAAQKTTIELPDTSNVTLNALSSLTYNDSDWESDRNVELEGEAFFKVAKGSRFNVKTKTGLVTVLGTEFNVKQRDNYFGVTCYEGSVKVTYNSNIVILKPGDSFLQIDGKLIATEKETSLQPAWLHNESYFRSVPFTHIIREFERQYNVNIISNNIDTTQLFTGSFKHDSLEMALKSITLPLNVKYHFKDDKTTIELSRD